VQLFRRHGSMGHCQWPMTHWPISISVAPDIYVKNPKEALGERWKYRQCLVKVRHRSRPVLAANYDTDARADAVSSLDDADSAAGPAVNATWSATKSFSRRQQKRAHLRQRRRQRPLPNSRCPPSDKPSDRPMTSR